MARNQGEARSPGKPVRPAGNAGRAVVLRKVAAIAMLAVLAGTLYLITLRFPMPVRTTREFVPLVLPIFVAAASLLWNRYWGRWLALAVAWAAAPWAAIVTFDRSLSATAAGAAGLAAIGLLLLSLSGRGMRERFEGRAKTVDWAGPRMRLLRWTIVANLVTALQLLIFAVLYDFALNRQAAGFVAFLAGGLFGVVLLARQKTAGLLLVWLCSILMVPAGILFIAGFARSPADALLFGFLLSPGVILGWTTMFVFGRPVWRFLRAG